MRKRQGIRSAVLSMLLILALALGACGRSAAPAKPQQTPAGGSSVFGGGAKAGDEEEPAEANTSGGFAIPEIPEIPAGTEEDPAGSEAEPEETSGSELTDADRELFAELTKYSYEFSSGVGGWATDMEIREDGSFSGSYYDSNMGEIGEGYEDQGTLYFCKFSGRFGKARRTGDLSWTMTLLDMEYEDTPGEEVIEDGLRTVYTGAYGLDGGTEFTVFMPGIPYDSLTEDQVFWTAMWRYEGYENGEFYSDPPEETDYCIIQEDNSGNAFCGTYQGEDPYVYLVNRAVYPGLTLVTDEVSDNGSYLVEYIGNSGLTQLREMAVPLPEIYSLEDPEALAMFAARTLMDGQEPLDLFPIEKENGSLWPELFGVNARESLAMFWTEGGAEDTRSWMGRAVPRDGMLYLYGISTSEYEEFLTGEARSFYLRALTFTPNRERLYLPEDLGQPVERQVVYAYATEEGEDMLVVDELTWLTYDDPRLADYGLTNEDVYDDYVLVDEGDEYLSYRFAEDCPVYLQFPPDGAYHILMTPEEFTNSLWEHNDGCLMHLFFNEDGEICFAYQPYVP